MRHDPLSAHSAMIERELKLYVPAAARVAVAKALQKSQAGQITLRARYYDTATRELANAGIALRLRQEGRAWVQTLKTQGADALSRSDLNAPRPGPTLDTALYDGTPLAAVFTQLKEPLALRYKTLITRTTLTLEQSDATIEIAYDTGAITAGELSLPVSEIEFELVAGSVEALFDVGAQWLQRFGLILDLRSKAERGDTLATISNATTGLNKTAAGPGRATRGSNKTAGAPIASAALPEQTCRPRRARSIVFEAGSSSGSAYLACANECLAQVIQNTAYAAGTDTVSASRLTHAEYVHQLRVGIRRLRSCWKLFNRWVPGADTADRATLRESFKIFGSLRDRDVIRLQVEPQIMKAGMPHYRRPRERAASHAQPEAVAAGIQLQMALLGLLKHLVLLHEHAASEVPPVSLSSSAARAAIVHRLNSWLKKIAKAGSRFEQLPVETQHDLRKQAKSLRYGLDFSECLLPRTELEPLRTTLTQIQKSLGDLNDYYCAEEYYLALTGSQPQVWFAIGWLRAGQHRQKSQAQTLFRQLAKHGPLQG
jgi:inorganic triphosphatase YgiF